MSLNLMYITNNVEVALVAEKFGVERIFVDMEYIGKSDRQGNMDTVQNAHTVEDVCKLRKVLTKSELLVRVNPIHNATENYTSSEEEINAVIDAGADIIMLPFFKTVEEVETFLKIVDDRCRTMLLVETPESVEVIDDIINLKGIDEMFIGLNDLSLGYGKHFMFELLADGTVEKLSLKFKLKGLPFGFGGIAAIGKGTLPSEYVIKEHYRLGSHCAILSRSFCNTNIITDPVEIENIFKTGLKEIRDLEKQCESHISYFNDNNTQMKKIVNAVS